MALKKYIEVRVDVERLYQVLHNNRTLTKTVNSKSLTLLAGEVSDIDINDFQGDEDNIDGLNVARLSFSCFVLRSQ